LELELRLLHVVIRLREVTKVELPRGRPVEDAAEHRVCPERGHGVHDQPVEHGDDIRRGRRRHAEDSSTAAQEGQPGPRALTKERLLSALSARWESASRWPPPPRSWTGSSRCVIASSSGRSAISSRSPTGASSTATTPSPPPPTSWP